MDSARKFVALALAACHSKQFEEAGIFLVQASKSPGSEQLAQELGADDDEGALNVSKSDDAVTGSDAEPAADEAEGSDDAAVPADDDAPEDADDDWGDEPEDEDSVSSGARRKQTSMFRIGKIMAAAMSVSSDDEGDDEEDDGEDDEVDPDFAGETLVPVSFSSVKVKSSV